MTTSESTRLNFSVGLDFLSPRAKELVELVAHTMHGSEATWKEYYSDAYHITALNRARSTLSKLAKIWNVPSPIEQWAEQNPEAARALLGGKGTSVSKEGKDANSNTWFFDMNLVFAGEHGEIEIPRLDRPFILDAKGEV